MEQTDQQAPATQNNKTGHKQTKTIIVLVVLITIISLSAFGVYYGQHKTVIRLTADLSHATQQVDYLKGQQTNLGKQIQSLAAKNSKLAAQVSTSQTAQTSPTSVEDIVAETASLPKLTLTITGAQRYSPPSSPNEKDIAVSITVTNATSSTITLPVSSFTLTDPVKNVSTDFASHAGETLPSGAVILNDITLAPGQTVKGALLFSVLNANYNNYTLQYDAQTYSVTVGD